MAAITLAGFTRHGELSGAGLGLFSIFLPLCVALALVAPWPGIFEPARAAGLTPGLALSLGNACPPAGQEWMKPH